MQGTRRGGKILVTEDNPLHMKIFKLNLTFNGYSVVEAENGERALELACREHPDLILVDLSLPKLNGWEMIKRMQEDAAIRDIPVIVVSARRLQDERAHGPLPAITAYIPKPFDPEALMVLVQETITAGQRAVSAV